MLRKGRASSFHASTTNQDKTNSTEHCRYPTWQSNHFLVSLPARAIAVRFHADKAAASPQKKYRATREGRPAKGGQSRTSKVGPSAHSRFRRAPCIRKLLQIFRKKTNARKVSPSLRKLYLWRIKPTPCTIAVTV